MANEEQLSILKQGVKVWNKWRKKNITDHLDLSGAYLQLADLSGANLHRAHLTRADLSKASLEGTDLSNAYLSQSNLTETDFSRANLSRANLIEANLRQAYLTEADLRLCNFTRADLGEADLSNADLSGAFLSGANLSKANLSDAKLSRANITGADLRGANLEGSDFLKAIMGNTIFGYSDLSEAQGLADVVHRGPSIISTETFALSKGKIPEAFLRGCGLSNPDIEYVKLSNPDLSNEKINEILYNMYDLRALQAIQIFPLFISYSHADSEFVDKLEVCLNRRGVRFWRDVHHATAGRLEDVIDQAIRHNPTVLLILSSNSMRSDWVEHEVRTARELEKDMGRDVLCPVALDDSWKNSKWPKRIMEQITEYHILDFSEWEDDSKFDNMFRKLIDGLELFYKG